MSAAEPPPPAPCCAGSAIVETRTANRKPVCDCLIVDSVGVGRAHLHLRGASARNAIVPVGHFRVKQLWMGCFAECVVEFTTIATGYWVCDLGQLWQAGPGVHCYVDGSACALPDPLRHWVGSTRDGRGWIAF